MNSSTFLSTNHSINVMRLRIATDIFLVLMMFMAPWWITMLLAVVGLFVFRNFFEIIIIGIMLDSLYNASVARYYNVQFLMTYMAIVLFVATSFIKPRLRYFE